MTEQRPAGIPEGERRRAGRDLSHEELDVNVRSLFAVGGLYELVAYWLERDERPRCTGTPTGVVPPWRV